MNDRPEAVPPTSSEIADWIRERIRRGQFAPEQRLVEIDIIRKTGGSRLKVREAIVSGLVSASLSAPMRRTFSRSSTGAGNSGCVSTRA